jgi:hypothetical protein
VHTDPVDIRRYDFRGIRVVSDSGKLEFNIDGDALGLKTIFYIEDVVLPRFKCDLVIKGSTSLNNNDKGQYGKAPIKFHNSDLSLGEHKFDVDIDFPHVSYHHLSSKTKHNNQFNNYIDAVVEFRDSFFNIAYGELLMEYSQYGSDNGGRVWTALRFEGGYANMGALKNYRINAVWAALTADHSNLSLFHGQGRNPQTNEVHERTSANFFYELIGMTQIYAGYDFVKRGSTVEPVDKRVSLMHGSFLKLTHSEGDGNVYGYEGETVTKPSISQNSISGSGIWVGYSWT